MKEMTEDISTFVTKLRKVPHTDYYERRIKRFSDQWKCIKQTCLDIPTYISINYILAFYFFSVSFVFHANIFVWLSNRGEARSCY